MDPLLRPESWSAATRSFKRSRRKKRSNWPTAFSMFMCKRASPSSKWRFARCLIQRTLVLQSDSLGPVAGFHPARNVEFNNSNGRRTSMTIFGKRLSEYVAFRKPFLGLILVVGIVRFGLSFAGVPNSAAKWFSITVVMWIGGLYYAVRIHTSGFGTYKHLLPICGLQSLTAQVIIVPAIILAIFTGHDNIYSAPEFSF